jgi:LuxR family transcriptional regulator of csgAB operon
METNTTVDLHSLKNEVYIIGSSNFFHDALALVLQRELGVKCKTLDEMSKICQEEVTDPGDRVLLFINNMEKDFDSALAEIKTIPALSQDNFIPVLFNLQAKCGIERRAFTRGVKGFFYHGDSLEHMLRGLRALLNGDLWMSRDILVEFALLGTSTKDAIVREKTLLTQREMQILALVSIGASNEEIADKLYISPHTVKTHLYNVFKKIGVPNRFQAALWAAKNL